MGRGVRHPCQRTAARAARAGATRAKDISRDTDGVPFIETVASREAYRNPWMVLREDDIRRPDGSPGSYAVVDKPTYALVMPYDGTRCVATEPFDLVIEGIAERVTEANELRTVAAAYAAGGWPAEAAGAALTAPFSAPSAGAAPWHLYRVRPSRVFALGTAEPFGATKFELG